VIDYTILLDAFAIVLLVFWVMAKCVELHEISFKTATFSLRLMAKGVE
jgi:hypothetical protein